MKRKTIWLLSATILTLAIGLIWLPSQHSRAQAQDDDGFARRAPSCTAGTVSGTYGYRLTGSLAGVGATSVIGIFTQTYDGSFTGRHIIISLNGQPVPNVPYSGTFTINSDCSATGSFTDATGLRVTFKYVATDGGDELYFVNTDAGNVLSGVARRISSGSHAPRCTVGTINGQYGYHLSGALQGVGPVALAGVINHGLDGALGGIFNGADTFSANGQIIPVRTIDGTFKMNGDCTGTGNYRDSLGQTINYAFIATGGGRELFLQGTDPGVNVSGFAKRL